MVIDRKHDRKTTLMSVVKKKVKDIEKNETKLTFVSPLRKTTVGTKIDNFQKLARGGECVLGSGRCGYHNCKLVRSVVKKKMSVVNRDGSIGWTMREVTTLACPLATQGKGIRSDSSADSPAIVGETTSTNKRARILIDQPQSNTQYVKEGADTQLDKKT